MFKKLIKALLCAAILVTGLVFNPIKTYANERGSVVQYSYITTTTTNTTYGGIVTIRLKVATINDGISTSMTYVAGGSTCSSNVSGMTCTISNDSATGSSHLGSISVLTITFNINLKKTTSATNLEETRKFKAYISKNKLTGLERQ